MLRSAIKKTGTSDRLNAAQARYNLTMDELIAALLHLGRIICPTPCLPEAGAAPRPRIYPTDFLPG